MLYIANVRLSTEKAHGAQIMKMCEAFATGGAEVNLVIPGRRTPINEDPFLYYSTKKNFKITTVFAPDLIYFGRLGFGLMALIFSERVRWTGNFRRADIIYSRDALVLLHYVLLGRTLVYEMHNKPTMISTFVARHAHRLVVISEGLRDAYVARGVRREKMLVAHDAVDLAAFEEQYDHNESRAWLNIPQNKKIVMYVGRIDSAKGVDTFAQAGNRAPADVKFVAVGSGPHRDILSGKYPDTLFLPETKYRDLPHVLAAADVLVIPNSAKDVDASIYTSPLKAFAYLAAGKPVLASAVPSLRHIFQTGSAHFFEPDNPQDLLATLKRLLDGPQREVERRIHDVSDYIHEHTWNKRAQAITEFITAHV